MSGPAVEHVIRARRAVIDGVIHSAAIGLAEGVIRVIDTVDADLGCAAQTVLEPNVVLMPGLVDTHVHIDDPGTDWEGFATATVAALEVKRAAAAGACRVDTGFWGGIVPDNLESFGELATAGVLGFKCLLSESGNPNFPPLDVADFRAAMAVVAELGSVLLVHAESARVLAGCRPPGGRAYGDFLRSRPDTAERDAVQIVLDAVADSGARAHIVHVSSSTVLPLVAEAKRAGLPVTAETCPHYLTFAAESIPDGGTVFAACPPIRGEDNRVLLWAALADHTLDMVVSDHSPCAPQHKDLQGGDFGRAFGGVSSLQIALPALWTEAVRGGFGLPEVYRWMAQEPAELAGLIDRGVIAPGARADFCVFDPDAEWVVRGGDLHHRHPVTPYEGAQLTGAVRQTWRGGRVTDEGSRGALLGAGIPEPA
ncbi:amidohydrolase family protein [Mycolicibacterium sarraceniae]|uniref:Allantoinase n=1 Tax=Mycolicibacterium sarraceniae TaxID=1534348 RepID=A0A7I7SVA3_9MYCO|nr:amidohydrolase family protein [Mycolicibacterium sarraceniae]BBY60728.1 allantoinase [Mycolicibacterium sarraceniae]